MKSKFARNRWRIAQRHEREYWDACRSREENLGTLRRLQKEYFQLEFEAREGIEDLMRSRQILEIGPGPLPLVSEFGNCDKVLIDPLADYYVRNFVHLPELNWAKAIGEKLPFPDSTFDLVVACNVIDHVIDPVLFVKEVRRVLRPQGILYLTVNCVGPISLKIRLILERLGGGDPCHPHTFTEGKMERLLENLGLEPAQRLDSSHDILRAIVVDPLPSQDVRRKVVDRVSPFVRSLLSRIEGPPICRAFVSIKGMLSENP